MEGSAPTTSELREELRGDAQTVTDTAKNKLMSEADARKGTAATQVKSLSSALDAAAGQLNDSPDWLRSLFQQGAQSVQRFADSIESKDSRQLSRDVQQLARDNPGTFLAGAALLGFVAARVLKAGVEDTTGTVSAGGQSDSPSFYDPYQPQAGAPTGTAFAGMSDAETAAQPAFQGEM